MPDHQLPFAPTTAPATAQATWEEQLAAADARFNSGAPAVAETAYLALIAAAPPNLAFYMGAARCARLRGDHAAALQLFEDAAAAGWAGDARVLVERAVDLQGLNRFAEAEIVYQAALDLAANNIGAWFNFAQCAKQRGDLPAALARFQAAAACDPANIYPRLEIANVLREMGQVKAAEAELGEVLALAPEHTAVHLALAVGARQRGDRASALRWFQAAAIAEPANIGWQVESAGELRELGRIDEAEVGFLRVLQQSQGDLHAQIGLGFCARKRNARVLSLFWFQAAAAAHPAYLPARLAMAIDLRDLGQVSAAEAEFQNILTLAPDHLEALQGIAGCARHGGDHQRALNWAREAERLAPGDVAVRLEIAGDLQHLGKTAEAETALRAVLDLAPNDIGAHLGLGHCVKQRGDPREAAAIFQTAMTIDPADPRPALAYAAQRRELGDFAAAERLYGEVLAAGQGAAGAGQVFQVQARHGLGHVARSQGDRDAALKHFEAARAADPNDLSAWLEIATEQRDAGDTDAARHSTAAVLQRQPGHLHALMSLGAIERHCARHEAALAAFQAAHDAWPAHAEPVVEMAVELQLLGQQDACDQWLATALRLNPNCVSAMNRLAEQAMNLGDLAAAQAWYQRGIAAEPGVITLHLGAAECLARLAKTGEALALLAALQIAHGPMPLILCKRLGFLRQAGDYPGAWQLAREATEAAPHAFELWLERFHCAMLMGSDAELLHCLASLHPATLHQRAWVHRLHGIFAESQLRYQDAIDHYAAGVAANPHDSGMQEDLVRCHLMRFDLAGARRHLKRFFEQTSYLTRLQKRSQNISQSLYGQILDEFALDAALAADLQAMQAEPAAGRIDNLLALIRANPDSTAPAIGLMIALRQAGSFDPAPHPPSAAAPIPKAIMQYWDSVDLPADVALLMQSWRDHNPDYRHILFDDAAARAYLSRHFPPPVLLAYHRGDGAAQKSDIFRLAYLALEGGVYADADDRCLAPLAALIPPHAELLLYQENVCSVGNNFLGVRPRHPVLVRALTLAVEAINRGDTDNVWLSTGPGLLTRSLACHIASSFDDRRGMPPGLTLLDRRALQRRVASNCILGYKYSNRHWLNAAFAKKRNAVSAKNEIA